LDEHNTVFAGAVRYIQQVFPWAQQSRRCKWHLDGFSRFCMAHWVTDRLTDLLTNR